MAKKRIEDIKNYKCSLSFFKKGGYMDYETLIFGTLTEAVPGLYIYFVIVVILDYIRTMLFN